MLREMIQFLAQMPTDISHNSSSGFGGNADSAEVADVAPGLRAHVLAHVGSAVVRRFTHQRADRSARKFLGHKPRLVQKMTVYGLFN
jgi:hypothetical protein